MSSSADVAITLGVLGAGGGDDIVVTTVAAVATVAFPFLRTRYLDFFTQFCSVFLC